MKINSYIKEVSKEEAIKIANNKGNIIGKMLLKDKDISTVKSLYIENKIITLNMTHQPNIITKSIFKKDSSKKQKITLIADGSTGGVAYYESGPQKESINILEDEVQMSAYEDDVLIEKAKRLARRIVRKQIGGNVSLELVSIESIFRPFYVAFYGELKEGTKIRYLPIAADGCRSKRTC